MDARRTRDSLEELQTSGYFGRDLFQAIQKMLPGGPVGHEVTVGADDNITGDDFARLERDGRPFRVSTDAHDFGIGAEDRAVFASRLG